MIGDEQRKQDSNNLARDENRNFARDSFPFDRQVNQVTWSRKSESPATFELLGIFFVQRLLHRIQDDAKPFVDTIEIGNELFGSADW